MIDLFFKSVKWFFFIGFIIGGIAAFVFFQEGDIKPLILAVLSFGGAYLMSNSWRDMPTKMTIACIVWVLGSALLAFKLPVILYEAAGIVVVQYNFFIRWAAVSFFPGVPVMMYIFRAFDE